jgi:hypothetical protein
MQSTGMPQRTHVDNKNLWLHATCLRMIASMMILTTVEATAVSAIINTIRGRFSASRARVPKRGRSAEP